MKDKFSYLSEPIFIVSLSAYALNQLLIILNFPFLNAFQLYYFNDLLLIPCCLPLLIFVIHKLDYRDSIPPTLIEVVIVLIIWSIFFEFIGPYYLHQGTGDILDIVVYWGGGTIAWFLWNGRNVLSLSYKILERVDKQ